MKKKYIIYSTSLIIGLGVFASCKKSFLQLEPKGQFAQSTYYQTPDQIFSALAAVYDPLVTEMGGNDGTYTDPRGPLNSASDDCYAGGGNPGDTNDWQLWNNYQLTSAAGPQNGFWPICYLGVGRANTLLNVLSTTTVPGLSDALKNRYTGEALFLRAHYYFDLERLFKNIPLVTKPVAQTDFYNQVQAKPSDVYAQIEADLNAAIPNLPTTVSGSELGRITQGAAIALLGKVLLYEQKWNDAAVQLAKVNGTSPGGTTAIYNYKLQTKFGAIFDPANKFNSESIFEWNYSGNQAYNWGNWGTIKGAVYTQEVGPRSFTDATYAGGWGLNPITLNLVNAFKHPYYGGTAHDPRYAYTILNLDSLAAVEKNTYSPGYQNTGYFLLKYAPLVKYKATQGAVELNYPNNYIEIRLADTYLMEAEAIIQGGGDLGRAAALINAVRARVGLGPVAATLANLKGERQLELATEAHRWFDLVRWNDAATTLAFKGFTSGKNELLPIPLHDLTSTKLVQNPGYAK